jgi:hypothetical protein
VFVLFAATISARAQFSGALTLQGIVTSGVSIIVTPVAGYNTLNISGGTVNQGVANVTEINNDPKGYTVRMTSINAGSNGNALFLTDTAGIFGVDTVPYSLTYGGLPVSFANGVALLTDKKGKTPKLGVTKLLQITIAPTWVNAGTYADTLTFIIISN